MRRRRDPSHASAVSGNEPDRGLIVRWSGKRLGDRFESRIDQRRVDTRRTTAERSLHEREDLETRSVVGRRTVRDVGAECHGVAVASREVEKDHYSWLNERSQ